MPISKRSLIRRTDGGRRTTCLKSHKTARSLSSSLPPRTSQLAASLSNGIIILFLVGEGVFFLSQVYKLALDPGSLSQSPSSFSRVVSLVQQENKAHKPSSKFPRPRPLHLITMSAPQGCLLGMGNPLLDMSATVKEDLLTKYELKVRYSMPCHSHNLN